MRTGSRTLLGLALCATVAAGAFGPGYRPVQAAPPTSHRDGPAGLEDLRDRVERELEAARARAAERDSADGSINVVDRSNVVVVVNSGGGSADASARQTIRVRQDGAEAIVEEVRD